MCHMRSGQQRSNLFLIRTVVRTLSGSGVPQGDEASLEAGLLLLVRLLLQFPGLGILRLGPRLLLVNGTLTDRLVHGGVQLLRLVGILVVRQELGEVGLVLLGLL